jgi:hypothetical protein
VEELDGGARQFVKDKRNLNKRANDMGVYKVRRERGGPFLF